MSCTVDFYAVVAGQPAALAHSAQLVRAQLAELDLDRWRHGTFGYVSMGAGAHAGHAVVHRLARFGRRAVTIGAGELVGLSASAGADTSASGSAGVADAYLFVSEGGRSRETIEAAGLVPAGARLALSNDPDAPLSEHVEAVIALGAGPDSRVYTIGYTSTLQAGGLLAHALDGAADGERWDQLPELAARTLDRSAPAAIQAAGMLVRAGSIDVVGTGASYASAAEAALLLREATRIPTATYETYQYLHGPMESLTTAGGVLLFGAGREVELARYLARAAIPTVLVSTAPVASEANLLVLTIPETAALSRAVLEMLPAQLLAGELARSLGLAINGFRYTQSDTKVGAPAAESTAGEPPPNTEAGERPTQPTAQPTAQPAVRPAARPAGAEGAR